MKRIVFIMIFAICCLTGCKNEQERVAEADSAVIYTRGQGFSKEGITFVQNEIVQYTDFATGVTMPLCSRLNCSHRKLTTAEAENGTEPCMAYVKDAYQAVLYRERLYVFTDNNVGLGIYVSDADGANRRLLTEIKNVRWIGGFSTEFYKDRLVIVGNRSERLEGEDGEMTVENYTGIYSIDCTTGQTTVCEKEWNDRVTIRSIDDTSVYVYYNYIDEAIYETYTAEELNNNVSLYADYQTVELWQCNLENGSATELYAGDFGSNCYPIHTHKDGVIIHTALEDGASKNVYRSFSDGEEVVIPADSFLVLLMEKSYALLSMADSDGNDGIYRFIYKDGTLEKLETDSSFVPSRVLGGNIYGRKDDKTCVMALDVFLSGGSEELYVMERLIYDTIR